MSTNGRGKLKVNYLGREGLVGHTEAPDYSYIYTLSVTKDSKWNVGDGVVLPDEREFRYARLIGANYTSAGVKHWADEMIAYAVPAAAQVVGDKKITVTLAATDGYLNDGTIAEDELRGGFIVIYNVADTIRQNRAMIGNTAGVSGGTITIYLDAPLTTDVLVTFHLEVMGNKYNYCVYVNDGYSSVVGIPAVVNSSGTKYGWVQRKGITCISPGSTTPDPGAHNAQRKVYFDNAGNIVCLTEAGAEYDDAQLAGTIMQRDAAGAVGPPFISLNID